jgi:hypothetical protein
LTFRTEKLSVSLSEAYRESANAAVRANAILASVMMFSQHAEKIVWVWSDRREREISVRVRYSVAQQDGCRLYSIHGREEWSV